MNQFIRVQSLIPLEAWSMRVMFTNGEQRDIDLTTYIAYGPIFEQVRNDRAFFRTAYVDGGTIVWPNGADIDPDVLYYGGLPPWIKDDGLAAGDAESRKPITESRKPITDSR